MFVDQLIAHRGWRQRYPENTLPAIQGALDAGARGIEVDIQLSADHEPILCHDATLQRLCADPRDITHSDWKTLATLSAHEPDRFDQHFLGTPLAKLSEAVAILEKHPQTTLYAEIKRHSLRRFGHDAVVDAVLPVLQRIAQHCVIISFDLPVLALARKRGWTRVAPVLTSWQQAFNDEVAALQPEMLFCDREHLVTPSVMRSAPFPLVIYEVPDYVSARHWLDQGAAFVESFAIGELLAAASKEGPHGNGL